jgi:hypothetical protein
MLFPPPFGYKKSFILLTAILTLFLAGFLGHAYAATYYVDNSITDTNTASATPDCTNYNSSTYTCSGGSASAYATIADINAGSFSPGDSILFRRGETWREQLVPPSSGSAGSPITFGTYGTGSKPILDGTQVVTSTGWSLFSGNIYWASLTTEPNWVFQDGTSTPLSYATSTSNMATSSFYYATSTSRLYVWASNGANPSAHTIEASQYPTVNFHGLVEVRGKSYIVFDGLGLNRSNFFGFEIAGCSHVTVQNSAVAYSFSNSYMAEENSTTNSDNIDFLSNTAENSGAVRTRDWGYEGVCINMSGVQTGLVDRNVCNIPDYTNAMQINGGASDVTFSNNDLTGGISCLYISSGYHLGGDTVSTTARYNFCHGTGHEIYAYQIGNEVSGSDIIGVNFYGNIDTGGASEASFRFGGTAVGYLQNVNVYNNTFYDGHRGIEATGPTIDASNHFFNNILFTDYTGASRPWDLEDASSTNYSPDYDVMYAPGAPSNIEWEGNFYNLAGMQAMGLMLHSLWGDPLFVSTSTNDFSLQSGSPVIDAGTTLSSTYESGLAPGSTWPNSVSTLNQNNYGSNWEIGAYVYGQGSFNNAPQSKVIVTNSAPSVSAVYLNHGSTITLTANATTSVDMNYTITDANGCQDILTNLGTSTAMRAGVSSTCALANPTTSNLNCYTYLSRTTSTCSGDSINVTDTVALYYFAQSTGNASSSYPSDHWKAWAQAVDQSNATGSAFSTPVNVDVLTAITVSTTSIDYGTVTASSTTGSTDQTATVLNVGNSSTSLQLLALSALTNGSLSIATGSQRYSTSTFTYPGTSTALTASAALVPGFFLTSPTSTANVSQSTFWGLLVPAGTATGTYAGTTEFASVWEQ